MTGEGQCTGNDGTHEHDEHVIVRMEPLESGKYIVLCYSGLCQRKRYIVVKQSLTVHCSVLYFELISIVTQYQGLSECCTLCDLGTETILVASMTVSVLTQGLILRIINISLCYHELGLNFILHTVSLEKILALSCKKVIHSFVQRQDLGKQKAL